MFQCYSLNSSHLFLPPMYPQIYCLCLHLYCCSITKLCLTLQLHELQHTSVPVLHYLPEFAPTQVHWVNNVIQPSHLLLSPFPLAFKFSQQQGFFQWVGTLCQVAKVLELHIQHQSFQGIFRVVSFRIDWFELLSVQGALKSLLQHDNSKASILWCSTVFMVQLSHPYMTTGKTIASSICTLVSKMMSLLFNMLARFVIVFLPTTKHLLISWLQSWVILESKKVKSVTVFTFPLFICHEVMWSDTMLLGFWMLSFKPAFSVFLFHPHQEAL